MAAPAPTTVQKRAERQLAYQEKKKQVCLCLCVGGWLRVLKVGGVSSRNQSVVERPTYICHSTQKIHTHNRWASGSPWWRRRGRRRASTSPMRRPSGPSKRWIYVYNIHILYVYMCMYVYVYEFSKKAPDRPSAINKYIGPAQYSGSLLSPPYPHIHTRTPTTHHSPSQAALVGKFDPQTEMEKAVRDLLVHARADKEAAVRVVCV